MKLNEIKQVLAERNLQLTKSLGQNFLHDANQLQRIIRAADLQKEDKILEIGPGLGPLTELLLAHAGSVLAIEKDNRLAAFLRERFQPGELNDKTGGSKRLSIVEADALEYLRNGAADWDHWKLVSNLPYSVASPILVELALAEESPKRMVATLQLEVAKRLMAKPGNGDYGVLTLLVQLSYEPREWFKIPAGCFFPEPEIDSACVVLAKRAQPLLDKDLRPAYVSIVKRSFSQRRKMMAKLLRAQYPEEQVEKAFGQVPLPLQIRAEKVTLEQFVILTRLLHERRNL